MKSISWFLAAVLNNCGKRSLLARYAVPKRMMNFKMATPRRVKLNELMEVRMERARMAMMSSVNKIPVMIRP